MKLINTTKSYRNSGGYTLIEMMVAVALFSIVLIVTLGSVMTIIDVNRKSQSLTVVMNDLNFVLDSMTRSLKTGEIEAGITGDTSSVTVTDQSDREITYTITGSSVTKQIDDGEAVDLTSDQIVIDTDRSFFRIFNDASGGDNSQPRVMMILYGTVQTSPRISSAFSIQTTVSQRNLDFDF